MGKGTTGRIRRRAIDLGGALQGRAVVVGIGNILRSDDGLGCRLVERLASRAPKDGRIAYIDAGASLENSISDITGRLPDSILIVDAVHLGLEAGEIELLRPEDLDDGSSFTHGIPLGMLCGLIRSRLPSAGISVLAVQPGTVGIGENLSVEAERALAVLEGVFAEVG